MASLLSAAILARTPPRVTPGTPGTSPCRRRRGGCAEPLRAPGSRSVEAERAVLDVDGDGVAGLDVAGEDPLRERRLHQTLHGRAHGARAERRVEPAVLEQEGDGAVRGGEPDLPLRLEPARRRLEEQPRHLRDLRAPERREEEALVEAVPELRRD